MNEKERPTIVIFTDGACSPNPGWGGWAAILTSLTHNQTKEFSGAEADTTNNRMELQAAVEGLSALKLISNVTVFTDSKYISNAFNQHWLDNWQKNGWKTAAKKPVANDDLWKKLLELTKKHTVVWSWVKGHAVDVMNERCDQLAVEARIKLSEGRK